MRARPLQRAVEQTIINPLASWLLEHPDAKNCKLHIDHEGGLVVTRVRR